LHFSILVAEILNELVQVFISLRVEFLHLFSISLILLLGFLENVLIDCVLEVGAEGETEPVEGLRLVVMQQVEVRELVELL
jgi:hypothetical protein